MPSKGRKVPPPTLQQKVEATWDDQKQNYNLDALWVAAGRPKGKEPINWVKGDGRSAVKSALAQGQTVISDDPKVQAEIQAIKAELQKEFRKPGTTPSA